MAISQFTDQSQYILSFGLCHLHHPERTHKMIAPWRNRCETICLVASPFMVTNQNVLKMLKIGTSNFYLRQAFNGLCSDTPKHFSSQPVEICTPSMLMLGMCAIMYQSSPPSLWHFSFSDGRPLMPNIWRVVGSKHSLLRKGMDFRTIHNLQNKKKQAFAVPSASA